MTKDETLNRTQAAAMARQVGIDFGASLTVALAYIGDRLGIFKLMAAGESLTSSQIAKRTGLNERYIREWASTRPASSSHGAGALAGDSRSASQVCGLATGGGGRNPQSRRGAQADRRAGAPNQKRQR